VPTVRRSRTLPAPPAKVWAIVSDPRRLADWWPDVVRVEDVCGDAFTQVLSTTKGRPVRADFRVAESRAPTLLRWSQTLPGTPFERFFRAADTIIALEPAADGQTVIALAFEQRLRGLARLGGFMVRRAGRGRIDGALGGLEELLRVR